MKVEIVEGCIACGLCVETCPEVFKMGDDGFAHVVASPNNEQKQATEEAAEGCPVSVIITED